MNSFRTLSISTVAFVLLAANGLPAPAQQPDDDQAAEAGRLIAQEIGKIELRTGTGDSAVLLERSKSSILHWTNPTLGTLYGDVFVWTKNGRAEAVASTYKFYSPFKIMGIEFQSLSRETLEAKYDGKTFWTPKGGDLEFAALDGAPEPPSAKFARLRQMRSLAAAFSVDATVRQDDSITRRLRMLSQPIFRYDSRDPEVLDGAIFVFVEGTDPELLLVLEARKIENGFEWQYAIGRMNSIRFEVRRNDKVFWKGEKLAPPWPNVRRPEKSYYVLSLGEVALKPDENGDATNAKPVQK